MNEAQSVLTWIEEHTEAMVEFLLEFGSVPSPRGAEREAADFLLGWLDDNDVAARRQTVTDGRPNVVGRLRGHDGTSGDDLLFNAHVDTAFGNEEEDARALSEQQRFHREVWREDGVLYGDDVVNDKGPMTGFLWAALALRECDVDLAGDVLLTAVAGEISGATVAEFQDDRYLGTGVGARRLVDGGVAGDYALVAETTDFAVARMECGVAWFEITVEGEANYQPRLTLPDPETVEDDHPGALPAAASAALALERWGARYTAEHTEETDAGTMRPSAGVGAIRAGNPPAPAVSPGTASLYLDVRLPPGEGPAFVREEIASVLRDAGVDATVDTYLFRRGHVADADAVAPLTGALADAHARIRGGSPPDPDPAITSMWRDVNVFNEAGIPAVTCGPPRVSRRVDGERAQGLRIDDLVDAAKLYAATAVSVCADG